MSTNAMPKISLFPAVEVTETSPHMSGEIKQIVRINIRCNVFVDFEWSDKAID